MKRSLTLMMLAGASSLVLAGCNAEENPGQSEPVNTVQDAAGAVVGAGSAAMLGANTVEGFVSNAAESDMYEIQAAEIALEKSQNARIRELAQMIQRDHQAAAERMRSAAQAAGQTLPTELDERRQGMLDNLRAASGEDFNRTYIQQQVAAHEEALTLHRGFADNTEHPELAAHARQTVAPVERHLEMAREIESSLGQ